MVDIDSVYNNLFSEAIPFLFKKVYFRFFFEVYVRTMPDIRFIDVNDDKFVSLLTYIVLEDLKVYGDYLPGLLIATPEEEESSMFNEAARKKQALKHSLEEQAKELLYQFDRDKQQREIDKFKDYKMKLSPLTATKSIPLYNDDKEEYWSYLTGRYGVEEEEDGLLNFLNDIFTNIESNPNFEMSKAFKEVVGKIRNVLATMSDTLNLVYMANPDELPNVPRIIKAVEYSLKIIKVKKNKFSLPKKLEEAKSEELEDSKEETKEDLAITDQNSDVQKILQLIRDHIIKGNLTIRQAFGLPDMNVDKYYEMHEFISMLKQICGKKATYTQIENATEFIFKGTLKLEEDKKKQDALAKIVDKRYIEKPHEEVINFKYFEQIIKKILKKAGYKPTAKKRERDEEQRIDFLLQKDDIALDFQNFLKLYLQYHDLLDETSELELLFLPYFSKLLRKLKSNVSKGSIPTEADQSLIVYFKNLMSYIGQSGNISYLLKIYIFLINCFDPTNQLNVKLYRVGGYNIQNMEIDQAEKDRQVLVKIQSLMSQAGVVAYTLQLISTVQDQSLLNICINLLISLMYIPNLDEENHQKMLEQRRNNRFWRFLEKRNPLEDEEENQMYLQPTMRRSNVTIQKEILNLLKMNNTESKLFEYIKNRLIEGYIRTKAINISSEAHSSENYQLNALNTKPPMKIN